MMQLFGLRSYVRTLTPTSAEVAKPRRPPGRPSVGAGVRQRWSGW